MNKTLFIMENGPSIKEVMDNPKYLQILKENHTFGLNAAYRAYEKYNFYPTYFGCFDYIINKNHKESFENLVLEDNSIQEFYFIGNDEKKQNFFKKDVRNNKKFKKFNFINITSDKFPGISKSFDKFYNVDSAGGNALQIGIMKGYKKIILIGFGEDYIKLEPKIFDELNSNEIESFDENTEDDLSLKLDEYISNNNLSSWELINKYLPKDVEIFNCSLKSNITCFEKIIFPRVLDIKDNYKKEISEAFLFLEKNNINKWYEFHLTKVIDKWKQEVQNNYSNISQNKLSLLDLIKSKNQNNINENYLKENNFNEKFISFILIIKDRYIRTNIFLENLSKLKNFNKYAKLIIVEDESSKNIDYNELKKFNIDIEYYLVNTGVKWSRSKLINYGLKVNELEYSLLTDVDFIYPVDFFEVFINNFSKFNFEKSCIGIPCIETNDVLLKIGSRKIRHKFDTYSHYYIYNTQELIKHGGFNGKIVGHGFEEREVLLRLLLKNHHTVFCNSNKFKNLIALHLSHSDILRGDRRKDRAKILVNCLNNNFDLEFSSDLEAKIIKKY